MQSRHTGICLLYGHSLCPPYRNSEPVFVSAFVHLAAVRPQSGLGIHRSVMHDHTSVCSTSLRLTGPPTAGLVAMRYWTPRATVSQFRRTQLSCTKAVNECAHAARTTRLYIFFLSSFLTVVWKDCRSSCIYCLSIDPTSGPFFLRPCRSRAGECYACLVVSDSHRHVMAFPFTPAT